MIISKLKVSLVLPVFTCIAVLLSGCMRLMERDFEKALEVTTIDIGMPNTVAKTVELPLGEADLRFVVPDYDCAQPLNASSPLRFSSQMESKSNASSISVNSHGHSLERSAARLVIFGPIMRIRPALLL